MQKITPHLWFDKEAKEATAFYASVFPNSKVTNITTLHNTPTGDCDVVSFELSGQPFMAISAGPLFKFNPSVSFHVKCRTKDEVDSLWEKLSKDGAVLMALGDYSFSERYGWLQDKYGVSWQLIYAGDSEITQKFVPMLMFVGQLAGKAEEAMNFYTSVFGDGSEVQIFARYESGENPDKVGTVKYGQFTLRRQDFVAMDSAHKHNFTFNEAISFIVPCDNQKEIDDYWGKLSADPNSEQCGWLKDKYGVSWQIAPANLNQMLRNGTKDQVDRVTQAFLKMKKFDIAELLRAYEAK